MKENQQFDSDDWCLRAIFVSHSVKYEHKSIDVVEKSENNDCNCFRKFFNDKFRYSQIHSGCIACNANICSQFSSMLLPYTRCCFSSFRSICVCPAIQYSYCIPQKRPIMKPIFFHQLEVCWTNDGKERTVYATEANIDANIPNDLSMSSAPSTTTQIILISLRCIQIRLDQWTGFQVFFFCNYNRYYAIHQFA